MSAATIDRRAWTKARRFALEVFFLNNGSARYSNVSDVEKRTAYWQCVDWMVDVNVVRRVGLDEYKLTPIGWREAQRLWNVPDATMKRMLEQALTS